jgi:hypothetical protein
MPRAPLTSIPIPKFATALARHDRRVPDNQATEINSEINNGCALSRLVEVRDGTHRHQASEKLFAMSFDMFSHMFPLRRTRRALSALSFKPHKEVT